MGDLFLPSSRVMGPFPMPGFSVSRPGIILSGPDRYQHLIVRPASYVDLVDKAAALFNINRDTQDITIVLAEQEFVKVGEDSIPALQDREQLRVKVQPRSATDTAMMLYQGASVCAESSSSTAQLPLELPPAPTPALLDLQPDDGEAQGPAIHSSAFQPTRPAAKSPLPSAMKVKTCPNQGASASGSTSTHTSLNSALGVAAPLVRISSSAGASSASFAGSPASVSATSGSGSSSGNNTSLPQRRKRDVRKERKKHAQQTIAREKALREAEAEAEAAARASLSPAPSQNANASGDTPTRTQSRRRISFVGVPADSEDDDDAQMINGSSPVVPNSVKIEKSDNSSSSTSKTMWDPDDSDESQESPAKRRKLNVDSAQAARMGVTLIPILTTSEAAGPAKEGSASDAAQDASRSAHGAEALPGQAVPQTQAVQQGITASAEERREADHRTPLPSQSAKVGGIAPSPLAHAKNGRAQLAERVVLEVSDSEEDEIATISPQRQVAPPSQSPKLVLPRGRPPRDPQRRAEYEQIKQEVLMMRSPDKIGSSANSPFNERRAASPTKIQGARVHDVGTGSPSGLGLSPPERQQRASFSHQSLGASRDVVGETPPSSPTEHLTSEDLPAVSKKSQLLQRPTSGSAVFTASITQSSQRSESSIAQAAQGSSNLIGKAAQTFKGALEAFSVTFTGAGPPASKNAPDVARTNANVSTGTPATSSAAPATPSPQKADAAHEASQIEPQSVLPSPSSSQSTASVATRPLAQLTGSQSTPLAQRESQAQKRLDFEYRKAGELIDALMNHPSNGLTRGGSARDFSRFLHEHREGSLNLLTIRLRVQNRSYHGGNFADTKTQDEPLENFANDLKRSWANMREFFGAGTEQAKSIGELEKFSRSILDEWAKKQARDAAANSAGRYGNLKSNRTGENGSIEASANLADETRRSHSTGHIGIAATTPNTGKPATARSGSTSGRSTPVLDAKAIQNAARNGGQLPSALGLTPQALNVPSKRSTPPIPGNDAKAGAAPYELWMEQFGLRNKKSSKSSSGSSAGGTSQGFGPGGNYGSGEQGGSGSSAGKAGGRHVGTTHGDEVQGSMLLGGPAAATPRPVVTNGA